MFVPEVVWPVSAALVAGSVVQGALGFAFGLVSVPMMVWAGVPLPVSIGAVLAAVVPQTATSLWRYRSDVRVSDVWATYGLRLIALPSGVAVLGWMSAEQAGLAKRVVGVGLLVAVGLLAVVRPAPRARVGRGWTAAAGLSSGFFAGLVGMGGPPLVLWAQAHDWEAARLRAFLWLSFLLGVPVQLALMVWRVDAPVLAAAGLGLALTPAVLAGAWAGHRVGDRLDAAWWRRVVLAVLGVMGVLSLVG